MLGEDTSGDLDSLAQLIASRTYEWGYEAAVIEEELHNASDRAAAIVGDALLDKELVDLIRAFLIDDQNVAGQLLGVDRPLGTFSARSNMAYALGLLSEDVFWDLTLIRRIRNEFAHDLHVTFDTPSVSQRCDSLELPTRFSKRAELDTARSRFCAAAQILSQYLAVRLALAQRERTLLSHGFLLRDYDTGVKEDFRDGKITFASEEAEKVFGQPLSAESVPAALLLGLAKYADANGPSLTDDFLVLPPSAVE